MSISMKSNSSNKTAVSTSDLSVDSRHLTHSYNGSTVHLYLYKSGKVVFAKFQWSGSVGNGQGNINLNFTGLNVPSGWRPCINVVVHAEHLSGTTIYNASCCTIYKIDTSGDVVVNTNAGENLSRDVSTCWIVS